MKRFINVRIMLISFLAILLSTVFCTLTYYSVFEREVMADLKTCTKLLSEAEYTADGDRIARLAEEMTEENIRMTLIRPDGTVAFDNVAPAGELDNHGNRAEIGQAFAEGEGSSVRLSSTIHRSNYYYAVRLEDGSVLRTAREAGSIFGLFSRAVLAVSLLGIILLAVCYLFSRALTRRILQPIREMAYHMDYREQTEQAETYPELEPILERIRDEHRNVIESSRIRQEFTANVSHELKTPLTSISGYSELIETGMATEADTRKFAAEIHGNADRLLTLINDILRLSEMESQASVALSTEDVDLYEAAQTCAAMLEPVCEKHGVSMQVSGTHAMVRANREMMEELIYNLCDNAIRYNREGGTVRITAEQGCLTVEDNGIGIAKEYQNRVFERFFRVDKSRSRKTGGTGLGLAIVKHIVELHQAELSIDSREGEGTVISVRFPQ